MTWINENLQRHIIITTNLSFFFLFYLAAPEVLLPTSVSVVVQRVLFAITPTSATTHSYGSREGRHFDCQKTMRSVVGMETENVNVEEFQIQSCLRSSWMHLNNHTHKREPATSVAVSDYNLFHFWFATKDDDAVAVCLCLWVAYTLHTEQEADALQHVSFCQDKQSSGTKCVPHAKEIISRQEPVKVL